MVNRSAQKELLTMIFGLKRQILERGLECKQRHKKKIQHISTLVKTALISSNFKARMAIERGKTPNYTVYMSLSVHIRRKVLD